MTTTNILQVAEWLPDTPDYPGSDGTQNIRNVVPLTPQSYGPLNSPMPVSNALSARCQGMAGFFKQNSNMVIAAGDATKLYLLRKGDSYVWQNATRLSGGPYSIAFDDFWEFEHFNDRILAVNLADAPQVWQIGTSPVNFANLAGSPPKAAHIGIVKHAFVMLGYIDDGTVRPQALRWSGAGDATNWATPGSIAAAQVQAGEANLFGDGGTIQAIRSNLAAADALIFQQYSIRRCMYAGPPDIFQFLPAENASGTPAPHSPVVRGGFCEYLGNDGWYSNDGAASRPIGANKVDKTFYTDVDINYLKRVVGASDPANKMIWWAYPSVNSPDGLPDRLLGHNWQVDRWTLGEVSTEMLCRVINFGYTLDELFTVLGYTLDTLPASLDSPIWAGGTLQLGLMNSQHRLSYLTGPPLAPTVETAEQVVLTGRTGMISGARPLIDGGSPFVSIGRRQRLEDDVVYTNPVPLNALGVCPVRVAGRFLRGVITAAAGGGWQNISGIEMEIVAQGKR